MKISTEGDQQVAGTIRSSAAVHDVGQLVRALTVDAIACRCALPVEIPVGATVVRGACAEERKNMLLRGEGAGAAAAEASAASPATGSSGF